MKTTWIFAASAHEKYDLGLVILGLYLWKRKLETTGFGILGLYWGYIEIMEKKMETTGFGILGLYWGYIEIMEKKMEARNSIYYLLKGDYRVW